MSQEIPTTAQTLHIDCSAAGIKMEEGKKIFEGSTINVHWFLLKIPRKKCKKSQQNYPKTNKKEDL